MATSGKGTEGLDLAARAMAEEHAARVRTENARRERDLAEERRQAAQAGQTP